MMGLRHPHPEAAHQRGVALITALIFVAILTSLSVYLAWDLSLGIRRTQDLVAEDQTYVLCLGAEAWASQVLSNNVKRHPGLVDLSQEWAKPMPAIDLGEAVLRGQIADLQGRLNLNDLPGSASDRTRFMHLLTNMQGPSDLTRAVQDWIGVSSPTGANGGTESGYYQGLEPPYRAANQPFLAPSMLRMVRGFNAKLASALTPELAALPVGTKINVNTAPQDVLRALGLSAGQAHSLLAGRPFTSVASFLASPALKGQHIDPAGLGVSSRYFLLRSQANIGLARTILYSVLAIQKDGQVRVMLRSRGVSP